MKILVTLALSLCLGAFAFAKPKDTGAYIQFLPTDTLYIQVIDSVRMGNVGRADRFRRIKSTLEDVFEDVEFPMEFKISRFSSARPPADQPFMMLTILKWGDYGLSQIEVQFSASLRREYDRNSLGMFYQRGGSTIMADERIYQDVLQKALEEMVFELNQRFAVATLPDEEEDKDNPYVKGEEEADVENPYLRGEDEAQLADGDSGEKE